MSCNVNGKGCRLCPGVWIAAALLFASLVQSFFIHSPANRLPTVEPSVTQPLSGPDHEIPKKDQSI